MGDRSRFNIALASSFTPPRSARIGFSAQLAAEGAGVMSLMPLAASPILYSFMSHRCASWRRYPHCSTHCRLCRFRLMPLPRSFRGGEAFCPPLASRRGRCGRASYFKRHSGQSIYSHYASSAMSLLHGDYANSRARLTMFYSLVLAATRPAGAGDALLALRSAKTLFIGRGDGRYGARLSSFEALGGALNTAR